jgi:2-polyprenyl-3-methyl-5-hydroxy-6-metoxy-1,4-benzoquinol methylase
MAIRIDPEKNEINALLNLVDFNGQRVLEIGCGDGRLTQRYARMAKHVTAIDPFERSILKARETLPGELRNSVDFKAIGFEDFSAVSQPASFDSVILSWSL